mmetsp:Transcript_20850/g.54370  ORF Transcript_20850/g.54370 Transcript_20850/m.54370 type:complete len:89 (-) Transcript_20850:1920-2186(-)
MQEMEETQDNFLESPQQMFERRSEFLTIHKCHEGSNEQGSNQFSQWLSSQYRTLGLLFQAGLCFKCCRRESSSLKDIASATARKSQNS